jgi:hypothetical protein
MPVEDKKIKIGDYNTIMNDRNIFNQVVYTPLSEALRLLDERRKDPELVAKVEKLLKGDIPEIFKDKKCAVMARQLATPNKESRRFIKIAKENNLSPVFFEYYEDKFTSNNIYKHSLCQLRIKKGVNKHSKDIVENINIIDFNKYNGSKLHQIKTVWGELLINFHKNLFSVHNIQDVYFLDEKDWYKKSDKEKPDEFYLKFFILNTCFGILFENFLMSKDSEGDFTKNIVLPTIEKVINSTGVRPLIVPLEPLDLEADGFWLNHLPIVKNSIKNI